MDSNFNRRPTLAEMMGSTSSSDDAPPPQPKRRQTMAEMLRETAKMGTTTSLVEAVAAAQAAGARKLEAEERAAALAKAQADGTAVVQPESTAAIAPPADATLAAFPPPTFPSAVFPPAVEARKIETAAPIPATPAAIPSRQSVNRYHLYTKIEGRWIWQCDLKAASHAEAFERLTPALRPEFEGLPIRLEQDENATPAN